MLKNAYFLAKIGADTAENEQHFAEILPIGSRLLKRRVDEVELELRARRVAPEGLEGLAVRAPGRRIRRRRTLRLPPLVLHRAVVVLRQLVVPRPALGRRQVFPAKRG